jgi:hypothetical protein
MHFPGDRLLAPFVPLLVALVGVPAITPRDPASAIDSLSPAISRVDENAGRLTIELPLIEVPANGTILTPVFRASVPFDISLCGFATEVVDEAGNTVPKDRLHHFLMTDPNRRELFLPLALPIFGASKESPSPVLPRYVFGVPLPKGGRYLAAAMLTNPEAQPRKFQVRLLLSYIHPGHLFPLFRVYPWTMDVKFPLGGAGGRHDFDVPAGRSTYSWEGSPRVPGTIIAMGGHAHDYVTAIQLTDVSSGDTIWYQTPIRDVEGHLRAIPIVRFYRWYRLGIHIEPSHTYRVTVEYDNPTGHHIPFGGMGSVAGLIVPDRRVSWPVVDPQDPIYRTQLSNLLHNMAGVGMSHDGHVGH